MNIITTTRNFENMYKVPNCEFGKCTQQLRGEMLFKLKLKSNM